MTEHSLALVLVGLLILQITAKLASDRPSKKMYTEDWLLGTPIAIFYFGLLGTILL